MNYLVDTISHEHGTVITTIHMTGKEVATMIAWEGAVSGWTPVSGSFVSHGHTVIVTPIAETA